MAGLASKMIGPLVPRGIKYSSLIVSSYTSNDVGFWKAGGHLYRFSSYRSYLFLQRHDVELVCSDLQRVIPPILETFPKCIVITLLIERPW